MRALLRKLLTFLLAGSLVVLLPGCWDYVAINTRSSIVGLGIDPVENQPEKMKVTIQFPILSKGAEEAQSKSSSGASSTSAFRNLSAEAYSLPEGIKMLQTKMDREIDIAQLRTIVFSEHLSAEMMDSAIGQLIRIPRINDLAFLLCVNGTAKDVLDVTGTEGAPTDFVDKALRIRQRGYVVNRELWQYWRDTTQVGVVPCLPIIRVQKADGSGKTLELGGLMVYRDNSPSFELSKQESFNINLILGHIRSMAMNIPINEGIASLTDLRASSRIRCVTRGNNLVLIDRVSVVATLAKLADPTPKPLQPTPVSKYESEAGKYFGQQITNTIKKLQAEKSDIVGFGRIYLQGHPAEAQQLKQQWEEMFAHAKLDIQVNVKIDSKGMMI